MNRLLPNPFSMRSPPRKATAPNSARLAAACGLALLLGAGSATAQSTLTLPRAYAVHDRGTEGDSISVVFSDELSDVPDPMPQAFLDLFSVLPPPGSGSGVQPFDVINGTNRTKLRVHMTTAVTNVGSRLRYTPPGDTSTMPRLRFDNMNMDPVGQFILQVHIDHENPEFTRAVTSVDGTQLILEFDEDLLPAGKAYPRSARSRS